MEASTISLYIDLEEGQNADLEIVARAALALTAALKDAAFVLDPTSELRIELVSGTEGSLSLNSVLKAVKDRLTAKNLMTLSGVCFIWFASHVADHVADKGFDWVWEKFFPAEVTSALTAEDKQEIAEEIARLLKNDVATKKVREVYSTLDKDPAIKGVGVTTKPGTRPTEIVPRAEFATRSHEALENQTSSIKRTREARQTIVIVRPVLKSGKYRWRVASKEGEFGVYIEDSNFMDNLLAGRISVPMVAGIELDVDLAMTEEKRDGVWQITRAEIRKVYQIIPPITQQSLALPPSP